MLVGGIVSSQPVSGTWARSFQNSLSVVVAMLVDPMTLLVHEAP
jgi:hypothetical protein